MFPCTPALNLAHERHGCVMTCVALHIDAFGQRVGSTQDEGLTLYVLLAHRVSRITGWSLTDGWIEEALAGQEVKGEQQISGLNAGNYRVQDVRGGYGILDRYFSWDGERLHWPTRLDLERFYQERGAVQFGDVRSAVALAMQETSRTHAGARRAQMQWARVGFGVSLLRDELQREAARGYVCDHLDRFMEREPWVQLIGSEAQITWAKKLRLKTVQRIGLEQQHDTSSPLQARLARLYARTMEDAKMWIDLSKALEAQPTQEVSALLYRMLMIQEKREAL